MKRQSTIAAVTCAFSLFASASGSAQLPDTGRLGTVVISASKVPRPADALTQAVTVISGDDLRARGVSRVTDALREVPAAMLVQSGSYGALTSLFLRGGESRYTKVLIDGVPVNAPGGSFDFSHLTTDNIDRIEVVRGPASVLYGADAATGVVQIFTRRPEGERRGSVGVRGGTYGSLDADADFAASSGASGLTLGAAHHSSDGILPFNNRYKNGTLSSNFTLDGGSVGDAKVSARYTAAEFHYPTDFTGQPVDSNAYRTQHRLTVGIDGGRNFSERIQARVLAGSNDVSDITDDIAVPFGSTSAEHSRFNSRGYRRNVEGRAAFFLPTSTTVTVGGAYEKERERSATASGDVGAPTTEIGAFEASRHNIAYYTEILGSPIDRVSYTLSGRVDDNSDYDRFATYRVGANVGLVPGVKARGSISTAFNAPAFNQLHPTLFTVGSPDLKPEKIRSAEIGLTTDFRPNLIRISATYFNQRFTDLIQFVSGPPPDFKGSFANLTAASSNGFETELALMPLPNLRASGSYTIVRPQVTEIDPDYEGGDRAGDALVRRPTHSGSLTISYGRATSLNLGTSISYVGKRPDFDFSRFPSPRVTLPAYAKVDLSAEVPVLARGLGGLTFTGRVENLFNKHYEDVLNFAAPGRTILLGARAAAMF